MKTYKEKVILISTTSGGGVSYYTKNLLRSLRGHGVDVIVFSNKPNGTGLKDSNEGVCACWNRGILYPFQIFEALATKRASDLVHIQHEFFLYGGTVSAFLFVVLLASVKILGKPVVTTIHGVIPLHKVDQQFKDENDLSGPLSLLKIALAFLTKTIVLLSDAVIVHEEFFADVLCDGYKCPRRKIHVIPHGVVEVESLISKDEAKRRLGFENKTIISFFGYLARYKGIETLRDAFGYLARNHPDWFLIIGGGKHPRLNRSPWYEKYISELRSRATSLSPKQIMFTGFIPDEELPVYFSATDVMVFPYTTAMSTSGPLMLAMGYGKPVITSDIPNFRELIPFKEARFKKNSSRDLAEKLELVLNSHDLRYKISAYVKRVGKKNSWSKVALRIRELYKSMLAR